MSSFDNHVKKSRMVPPLISSLNIEYITNETVFPTIPVFKSLQAQDLKADPVSSIRLNLAAVPFICENYKYDLRYLATKLWSYTDLILFFYNRSRFVKYLNEMNLQSPQTSQDATLNNKNAVEYNVQVTLLMLFQCSLKSTNSFISELSIMEERLIQPAKLSMTFSQTPLDTALHKIVWLNDSKNNPVFYGLVVKAELFNGNIDQIKQDILDQVNRKMNIVLNLFPNKIVDIPEFIDVKDNNQFSNSVQLSENTKTTRDNVQTKLTALLTDYSEEGKLRLPFEPTQSNTPLKEIKSNISSTNIDDFVKNTRSLSLEMGKLEDLLQKLKTSTSYSDRDLIIWTSKTARILQDLLNAGVMYKKAAKVDADALNEYSNAKADPASTVVADLQRLFPLYHDVMEEAFRLTQTFNITADGVMQIIQSTGTIGKNRDANTQILKYSPSVSGKTGYAIMIAIEYRTANTCMHSDLVMGSFMTRKQNIHIMKYAPPYFLSEIPPPPPTTK